MEARRFAMSKITRPPDRRYTGADLRALRHALGLSTLGMAETLGIEGFSDKVRDRCHEMEDGRRELSGPLSVVVRYLSQAADPDTDARLHNTIGAIFPRFLECSDLEDEDGAQLAMHTRWPRFYALEAPPGAVPDDLAADALRAAGAEVADLPPHIGGGHLLILWIDEPTDPARADAAIAECVRLTVARAESDLAG